MAILFAVYASNSLVAFCLFLLFGVLKADLWLVAGEAVVPQSQALKAKKAVKLVSVVKVP